LLDGVIVIAIAIAIVNYSFVPFSVEWLNEMNQSRFQFSSLLFLA